MTELNYREYQTVIMGALLHDVGKMLQRGSFGNLDTKGQHPQVSSDFVSAFKEFFAGVVNFDLLKTLVQRHHEDPHYFKEELLCQNAPEEYKALSYLVSRADNYSSSERGKQAGSFQDYRATPLVSIFSRIRLADQQSPEPFRYNLNPLKPEDAFPQQFSVYADNEVNRHLQEFGDEFRKFVDSSRQVAFDVVFSNLLTILMKYAWCIPSNTQEEVPDVSLFDHLKTTTAISACLYQYHSPTFDEKAIKDDKTEKFVLLAGDLSGIQSFIFNITHIGAGGVAKRLRARSFQVNMISEMISHKILHTFNLPLSNILMASGGKFYLLLPNIAGSEEKIAAIKREVDEWFYEKFNAEINLNIATLLLSGKEFKRADDDNDIGRFEEVMRKINEELQRIKKEPFSSILVSRNEWNERQAVLDIDFGAEERLCKACAKFPGEYRDGDQTYICDRCFEDKKIGTVLHNAKYISFYKDDKGRFQGSCGYSFDLGEPSSAAYLVMPLGEQTPLYNYPFAHRYIANYIPVFPNDAYCDDCKKNESDCKGREQVQKDQPMFFECLANESKGRPLLGYLKADADNLGAVFAMGLDKNKTVSRVTTLSRMLDVFFSGYMQKLIEADYPEIYTVYSGGDDILVIGPWDSIVRFGEELNRGFRRFTCGNNNLTLSAGIAFVKHNHPVFRAVKLAEDALERSKNMKKNCLTVFGQTVQWNDVQNVIKDSEQLATWLEARHVSSGFVHNLIAYSQMNDEFTRTKDTTYLRFLPLLTYDIARNLPSLNDRDPEKRAVREWAETLKNDLTEGRAKYLGIVTNYALTANRGGKNG